MKRLILALVVLLTLGGCASPQQFKERQAARAAAAQAKMDAETEEQCVRRRWQAIDTAHLVATLAVGPKRYTDELAEHTRKVKATEKAEAAYLCSLKRKQM